MSTIESNKTLAIVGSILLVIGGIPFVPYLGILSLVGVVLLLMAIRGFSQNYQDASMYDNALKGLIYYIIGAIMLAISTALFWASIASFVSIYLIGLGIIGIVGFIITLVIAFIFYFMAAKRLRVTLNSLAQKTGVHSFATAGTLLYWGAILMIFYIGSILIFIAWIFAFLGFFSMRTSPQPYSQQQYGYAPPPPPPPAAAQPAQAGNFCPNCGAPIQAGSTFCTNCGKPLNQTS